MDDDWGRGQSLQDEEETFLEFPKQDETFYQPKTPKLVPQGNPSIHVKTGRHKHLKCINKIKSENFVKIVFNEITSNIVRCHPSL